MPHVVESVLAIITEEEGYLAARKQAETLSQEYGLPVADLPMVIQAMTDHPKVHKKMRPYKTRDSFFLDRNRRREFFIPHCIDTITMEYHGKHNGFDYYGAWHSAGSLASAEGLVNKLGKFEGELNELMDNGFIPIDNDEWKSVRKGSFNGQSIECVNMEDARKGKVPNPGTPYTIDLQIPKGYELISTDVPFNVVMAKHKSRVLIIFEDGKLNGDQFRIDDRINALCGGPDGVERLHNILFVKEGYSYIVNYNHRINKRVEFSEEAKGRLVYLNGINHGIGGDIANYGCFAVVKNRSFE